MIKAKSTIYLSYKVDVSTEYMLDQMAAAGKRSPYQKVVTCRYTEVWRCRECDAELPSFITQVCPRCKANLVTEVQRYEV